MDDKVSFEKGIFLIGCK